ncbi:MAG: IS21-like element helper ATPase IstB [Candidatus Omnitrophica bacterium]|nr:IS21-like element helper ATPase IstB [Candidatus Omnitrophota bacterium]MBU1906482.1 IS21-like element helper ATPase IstB [Candidatus Omnitrophota bacterium]
MLSMPVLDKLRALRLYGILKSYQEQTESSDYAELSFEERFGLMIDRELTEQENKRLSSRLRRAKLRQQACMENIDYRVSRGLDKSLMKCLSTGQWIKEKLNVLITGPCGVGKSFIACALAQRACLERYTALYVRAPRLFEDIAIARGDGRYSRLMNSLAKTNLLVIDDWGLSVLTEQQRRDLLELLEDRHDLHSTIITSQLPVKHWHEIIGNQTLADAILDRLVHNAYNITLRGDSMRKKRADSNNK